MKHIAAMQWNPRALGPLSSSCPYPPRSSIPLPAPAGLGDHLGSASITFGAENSTGGGILVYGPGSLINQVIIIPPSASTGNNKSKH